VFSRHTNGFSLRGILAAVLLLTSLLIPGCASVAPKSTSSSQASLSLSTTSLNFNSVVIGQSATKTLQVSNTGTAALTIESLSLHSQQFSFTGPSVPRTILPAQSVSYNITFAPTASGSLSAAVEIGTNASTSPAAVSLAGVGEKALAALQVTPASIGFGNHTLQTTSTQNVTLKNTGDISLTISGVTVTGAGFALSSLAPGVSLSPNQSVTFQISFHPTAVGAASGTVSILSANISSPQNIPLSGDGVSSTSTTPIQHTVSLAWDASSSAVSGYRVYRSAVSGANFAPLTALNALSYTDDTVASGRTYFYVVTAVDSAGVESTYSNQVTAIIP